MRKIVSVFTFLNLLLTIPAAIAQANEDYFFANNKKVPVVVSVDRIGAIGRDKVTAQQVNRFLEPLGLKL